MPNELDFPVVIDPKALGALKRLVARKNDPTAFLRIGVKGGGCSGFEYVIKADTATTAFDVAIEMEGLKIVSDTKSSKFLQGSVLEFTGNLMDNGIRISNPNAARSCGCGTSFTPKE